MQVNVSEAKKQLSKLLRRVACGEEVVIAKAGKAVAKLIAIKPTNSRPLGTAKGFFVVPEDFNDPVPEFERDFYEGDLEPTVVKEPE